MTIPTSLLLREVVSIYNALSVAKDYTVAAKATYSLIAIRNRLKPVIDAIEEINKEPEEITTYNKKKTKLCTDYSLKDAAGDPILYNKPGTQPGVLSYSIDPNKSVEFQEKMAEHNKENQKVISEWQNKIDQIQTMLNQPSTEFRPEMLSSINLSWFKAEIKSDVIEALFPILVNDTTETA